MLGKAMLRDSATKILTAAVEREAVVQLVEQLQVSQLQTWKVIECCSLPARCLCVICNDSSLQHRIADKRVRPMILTVSAKLLI
jgi:hypothetical protein